MTEFVIPSDAVRCRFCGSMVNSADYFICHCSCHGTFVTCTEKCAKEKVCSKSHTRHRTTPHNWNIPYRTNVCNPVCLKQHQFIETSSGDFTPYDSESDKHWSTSNFVAGYNLYCESCVPIHYKNTILREWISKEKSKDIYISYLPKDIRGVLNSFIYSVKRLCDVCGLHSMMYQGARYGFKNICIGCVSAIEIWHDNPDEKKIATRAKSKTSLRNILRIINSRISTSNSRSRRKNKSSVKPRKPVDKDKVMALFDKVMYCTESQ